MPKAPTMTVSKLPDAALLLITRYQNLRIEGASVLCPYHINTRLYSRSRALVGKGRPEEIEAAAEKYLARFQMHANGNAERLRLYLTACGIGVDCSGFVSWILNILTTQRLHKPLWKCLTFRTTKTKLVSRLRPVENISANVLTGELNTVQIADLNQLQPGDLIRLINGGHVTIITEVGHDSTGHVQYFCYAQSTVSYGEHNGIDEGRVTVVDARAPLAKQQWSSKLMFQAIVEGPGVATVVRLRSLA